MSTNLKLAFSAAAVIAVVLAGAFALRPSSDYGVGGAPSPSPSPTASPTLAPSPTPSATPVSTVGWVAFQSNRYAYRMSIPPDWTPTQSSRAWSMVDDRQNFLTTAADGFRAPGNTIYVSAFAVPLAGSGVDAWLATYSGVGEQGSPNPCAPTPIDLGVPFVDGHAAITRREPDTSQCGGTHAFVQVGDTMYVFSIWLPGHDELLKAFLSTVRFVPATGPSSSPGSSASPSASPGPS